jgi:hypothetical protein
MMNPLANANHRPAGVRSCVKPRQMYREISPLNPGKAAGSFAGENDGMASLIAIQGHYSACPAAGKLGDVFSPKNSELTAESPRTQRRERKLKCELRNVRQSSQSWNWI